MSHQRFEYCQKVFSLLKSRQWRKHDLLIQCYLYKYNRIILSLKPWSKSCLVRWLKPRFNVFNSFKLYGIWVTNIENAIMRGSSKLQKYFLKILIHLEYRISRLSLFHSNVEERKIYIVLYVLMKIWKSLYIFVFI